MRPVEADPVFSPSGDQIVYNSNRNRTLYNTLYLKSDDASGQETELVKMERLTDSPDWSHDGQTIVFTGGSTGASNDLWLLPLSGDRKPRGVLRVDVRGRQPGILTRRPANRVQLGPHGTSGGIRA